MELQEFADQELRDAAFGLCILTIVLLSNTFFFLQVFIWFSRVTARIVNRAPYKLIARFMQAVLLMCLVQIISILLWTAAIYANDLMDNLRLAMLFAGSCYTTLGIISDNLPKGWQSLAFYIAFSGLFSFAMATSAMMAMLSAVRKKIYSSKATT